MRRTYQKDLAMLDRSEDSTNDLLTENRSAVRSASADGPAGNKKTFRRQTFKDELTLKPQINKNTNKYLKRH